MANAQNINGQKEYAVLESITATPAEADVASIIGAYNQAVSQLDETSRALVQSMSELRDAFSQPTYTYSVRDRAICVENYHRTLSGNEIPKVALPQTKDWGEILKWRLLENAPGQFPYTAGVFPYKRTGEDPTRMFAGEGHPERTNHRFHYLSRGQAAARLSTAFDSVTLYGRDPATQPDVYGKVGNSGVSIATLDDAKRLYSGFDLCAPTTSVSMTINGPAPMLLAMFFNTAIDQAVEKRLKETGRWEDALQKFESWHQMARVTAVNCLLDMMARAWGSSVYPVANYCRLMNMHKSRPRHCPPYAARFRQTFSRKTKRRTHASFQRISP